MLCNLIKGILFLESSARQQLIGIKLGIRWYKIKELVYKVETHLVKIWATDHCSFETIKYRSIYYTSE